MWREKETKPKYIWHTRVSNAKSRAGAACTSIYPFNSIFDAWSLFINQLLFANYLTWMLTMEQQGICMRHATSNKCVSTSRALEMVNWSDLRLHFFLFHCILRNSQNYPAIMRECNDMKFTSAEFSRQFLIVCAKVLFQILFHNIPITHHKTVNLFPILCLDRILSSMDRIVRSQYRIRSLPPWCHSNRISFWLVHLPAPLADHKLQNKKKKRERTKSRLN